MVDLEAEGAKQGLLDQMGFGGRVPLPNPSPGEREKNELRQILTLCGDLF